MMGYKDITWCTFTDCKRFSNVKCLRAFTEEDAKAAEEWWGSDNYPIVVFANQPECFEKEDNA